LNTGLRMIFPFLAIFAKGLGVDIQRISLIISISLVTSILGTFLAPSIDRRGRKIGMLLGMGVFTIGTGMIFFIPTYAMFFVGLLCMYLGTNIFTPSMLAYIGEKVAFSKRGASVATTEISWSLSFIFVIPLVGFIMADYSWSSPFLLLTVLGIVTIAFLTWMLPKHKPQISPDTFTFQAIKKALTHRSALAVMLMAFSALCGIGMINLMFGVWLGDTYHLQITSLGVASSVLGIAELVGASLSAVFSDRLGKKRTITWNIILAVIVILLLPLFLRSFTSALIWLFMFYIFSEYIIVSSMTLATEVVIWARTTYISVFLASLTLGMGFGSYIAPYIYRTSFQALSVVCGGLLLIALLALSQVKTQPEQD